MQIADLRQGVQLAKEGGSRVVQLDEFVITKNTLLKHAWSLPKTNEEVDLKQLSEPVRACIVAASVENGVEHFESFDRSVNKKKFNQFLEHMRERYPHGPVTLMFDNLSLHTSKDVLSKMEMLGYSYVTTPKCKYPSLILTFFLV